MLVKRGPADARCSGRLRWCHAAGNKRPSVRQCGRIGLRPAANAALTACRGKPSRDVLLDQLALEPRQRRQHVEMKLAARRRG